LAPADRRRHLVRVAADVLTTRGLEGVQFPDVARAAGVTRQFVYRFFPNRQSLVLAVLEGFAEGLSHRFAAQAARHFPSDVAEATRIFVEAVCDTIEEHGAGPWRLLGAPGDDAQVQRIAHEIEERLLAPWRPRIAVATGASRREVSTLARMIVAAARVVLEQWNRGELTRADAARDATRGVAALLAAFTTSGNGNSSTPRRAATRRRH
jgi:AcrR family transcriptional regulator